MKTGLRLGDMALPCEATFLSPLSLLRPKRKQKEKKTVSAPLFKHEEK